MMRLELFSKAFKLSQFLEAIGALLEIQVIFFRIEEMELIQAEWLILYG